MSDGSVIDCSVMERDGTGCDGEGGGGELLGGVECRGVGGCVGGVVGIRGF